MTVMCKYFSECGGCDLQNLTQEDYYSFKRNIALKIAGKLNVQQKFVAQIEKIGWNSRRRVEFQISKNKSSINLGFFKKKTHEVVDIDNCPLLAKQINKKINEFKYLISDLKRSGLVRSLSVTLLAADLDVIINTKSDLAKKDQDKIISYCRNEPNIKRVALTNDSKDYDVIYDNQSVTAKFDDIEVQLPVNGFLQATSLAQNLITQIILENINHNDKVLDLFCGCGAYSFPLLKKAALVRALEGGYEMVLAANKATVKNKISDRISFEARDLFKNPLKPDQLKLYDAIIINPPRAGAVNQIKEIAKNGTKLVIMVSCNPETFQRDAKILVNEGYLVKKIYPIDQFYQTKHLELVAIFQKQVN